MRGTMAMLTSDDGALAPGGVARVLRYADECHRNASAVDHADSARRSGDALVDADREIIAHAGADRSREVRRLASVGRGSRHERDRPAAVSRLLRRHPGDELSCHAARWRRRDRWQLRRSRRQGPLSVRCATLRRRVRTFDARGLPVPGAGALRLGQLSVAWHAPCDAATQAEARGKEDSIDLTAIVTWIIF